MKSDTSRRSVNLVSERPGTARPLVSDRRITIVAGKLNDGHIDLVKDALEGDDSGNRTLPRGRSVPGDCAKSGRAVLTSLTYPRGSVIRCELPKLEKLG
jgi:hypothetical protein